MSRDDKSGVKDYTKFYEVLDSLANLKPAAYSYIIALIVLFAFIRFSLPFLHLQGMILVPLFFVGLVQDKIAVSIFALITSCLYNSVLLSACEDKAVIFYMLDFFLNSGLCILIAEMSRRVVYVLRLVSRMVVHLTRENVELTHEKEISR